MRHSPRLPIEQVLPALRDALRGGRGAVLQAPPGAGKTTGVPLALLGEPWLRGRGIVMLEPRRLAARAAARRMATLLGEGLGQTVGYRIRHESAIGPTTRVLVVTEGVLTRMLQSDPALERFGLEWVQSRRKAVRESSTVRIFSICSRAVCHRKKPSTSSSPRTWIASDGRWV